MKRLELIVKSAAIGVFCAFAIYSADRAFENNSNLRIGSKLAVSLATGYGMYCLARNYNLKKIK